MLKLPRGIEKNHKTYRVTVSVGGVPVRRTGFPTVQEAITERDELYARAKYLRDQRQTGKKKKKNTVPTVTALDQVSNLGIQLAPTSAGTVGTVRNAQKPTNHGIDSRVMNNGAVKFSVRVSLNGKMKWGGSHNSFEEAVAARNLLKRQRSASGADF